ncbi:MAG: FkbM family methyltransferase [Candidatus Acidiferrales bacterium]
MDGNRISEIKGGANAQLQAWLLRAGGMLVRHFGFRGMQRYASLLNRCFRRENSAVITLAGGGVLAIYLGDGYWAHLVAPDFLYEPEVGFVLTRALQLGNVFFFDCGANIGPWSAVAAAIIHKPEQVIAIEASPLCFERLQQNALLNDGSFHCIMRAIWSCDSENLLIVTHERRHVGSS